MMYDGTTILLHLAMVSILGKHISALCTPFAYNRESDCSNALANSTSQACSEMNLTTDRGFCELRSLADIEYLESVARILGTTKLSVNSFIIFMYITIMRPCTHHNIYVYVRACVCVFAKSEMFPTETLMKDFDTRLTPLNTPPHTPPTPR